MADVSEDLISQIIASSTTLSNRVHQNVIPQSLLSSYPRAYIVRIGRDDPLDLGGGAGIETSFFAVEYISDNIDEAVAAAAASARTAGNGGLHGIGVSNTFGNGKAQRVAVEDADDEYIPRGTGGDTGVHVVAHNVKIVGHTT